MHSIILLTFLFFFQTQHPPRSDYDDFISFIRKNFKVTAAIRKNCDWQYEVVKVKTDATGRVSSYELLDGVSTLDKSFEYLIGYRFGKNNLVKNKTLVFYYTIQNDNENCDIQPQIHLPTDVTSRLLATFNQQRQKQPSTIFIYETIINVIYPAIK